MNLLDDLLSFFADLAYALWPFSSAWKFFLFCALITLLVIIVLCC